MSRSKPSPASARRLRIVRVLLHGVTTGARLAEVCGASLRTIYRDVRALRDEGLPIAGEIGAGYRLQGDLEQLPLTPREAVQIVLQLRSVGPKHRGHARIEAAMPATLLAAVDEMREPRAAVSGTRGAADALVGALAARTLAGGPR